MTRILGMGSYKHPLSTNAAPPLTAQPTVVRLPLTADVQQLVIVSPGMGALASPTQCALCLHYYAQVYIQLGVWDAAAWCIVRLHACTLTHIHTHKLMVNNPTPPPSHTHSFVHISRNFDRQQNALVVWQCNRAPLYELLVTMSPCSHMNAQLHRFWWSVLWGCSQSAYGQEGWGRYTMCQTCKTCRWGVYAAQVYVCADCGYFCIHHTYHPYAPHIRCPAVPRPNLSACLVQ